MQQEDSTSRGCGLRANSSHLWTHAVFDVPILTTEKQLIQSRFLKNSVSLYLYSCTAENMTYKW